MTAKRKAEPSETAPQPHQRVHEPLQAFEQHQNELLTSISAKLEEICAQQTEKTVRRLKTTQTKALASLSQKLDTLKVFATNLEELKAQIETTQSEYRTALAALQAELNSVKKNTSDQLRAILNEVRRGRSELAGRIFEPRPSYMEGINRVPRETKIIASLTSYSKRIDFVAPCAYSLLHQTMKPDMVVLWLAESDFPHRTADLPRELVRLQELGLSIEWCEELRPHKKYYEAMKRWPDDIIITFDDDVIYPAQIVESLFKAWQKHPDSVCTTRARRRNSRDCASRSRPPGS